MDNDNSVNINVSVVDAKEPSYFDGTLTGLFLTSLLGAVVTLFTLGICLPWSIVIMERYKAKHTVINGRRLTFDGTAVGLFGQWIKWFLLTIITLGIYGLWVKIAMKKWVVKHTHFE